MGENRRRLSVTHPHPEGLIVSRSSRSQVLVASVVSLLLALSISPRAFADEATPTDPTPTVTSSESPDAEDAGTPESGSSTPAPDADDEGQETTDTTPSPASSPSQTAPGTGDQQPSTTEVAPQSAAVPPKAVAKNGIPALSITLDDGKTLADVHRSKEIPWPSSISLADPADSANDLSATGVKMKGRGNSTWTLFQKKPYQIKFEKKTSLLGMPKAKAWVLLANHADATLLRNNTAFTAANALGTAATPQDSRFVDLTVNGEYLGVYQLTEKIEVGEGRLDLQKKTGVMVEMDNTYGNVEPIKFKSSTSHTTFVLKDQVGEVSDDNVMDADVTRGWEAIQAKINEFDKLVYASKPDWEAISKVIDVDSFARFYLLEEYTSDSDVSVSSIYFYMDGVNDLLHMGPAWDYDITLGNCDTLFRGVLTDDNYVVNTKWYNNRGTDWYTQLFRNPEFVRLVNKDYDSAGRNALSAANASIIPASQKIEKARTANFAKWSSVLGRPSMIPQCGRTVTPTASQEVQRLKSWTSKRAAYMDTVYGDPNRPVLSVQVSTQSAGWHPTATGGMMQGTTGQSKRLEALRLALLPGADEADVSGGVQTNAYVSGAGWQGWTTEVAGTTGKATPLEAVRIQLTGDIARQYDVRYRVYAQSYGWLNWVSNGQNAGTSGQGKRLEAIQVQLVDKGSVKTTSNFADAAVFYLNDSWGPTANHVFPWGVPSDVALAGDWNADGADTVALRRGNRYAFTNQTTPSASPNFSVTYGKATDQVLVGDWNGDGKDTLAVRRGNTYYIKNSINGGTADTVVAYGKATDHVLVGHFSKGSSKDSFTVRRGNKYFVSYSIHGGEADKVVAYGRSSDSPIVGDWNGDGVDTLGVRR